MTAIFNFQALLMVFLLLICTSAYAHQLFPSIMDRNKDGVFGLFWKCARIGERLSPYISLCCLLMAGTLIGLFTRIYQEARRGPPYYLHEYIR